jgi:DNA modification methylase
MTDWRSVPIADIKPNPNNPRIIKDDKFKKLVQSIKDFPEMLKLRPIVVNAEMVVLGGNMRLKACQAAGLTEVPTILASGLTDERQREFIIKDNVGFGEWEWETLANEWDADILAEWGLDVPDFEKAPADGLTDPDEVPEAPAEPISVLGDLWVLGNHRVLCGDSTSVNAVELLMNGQKADICFTSPPYALGKSMALSGNSVMSKKKSAYDLHDDSSDNWDALMRGWFHASVPFINAGWVINVQPLAGNKRQIIQFLADNQSNLVDIVTWDKGHAAPQIAPGVMASRYEWMVVLSTQPEASRVIPCARWQGTIQSVYNGPPQRQNEYANIHAATFPAHLPTWVIGTLCDAAQSVYDPFMGTGTTLIAAEQLGRQSYGMEISPQYVDVIVKRWQDFTGRDAIHSVTGETFNQMASSRK